MTMMDSIFLEKKICILSLLKLQATFIFFLQFKHALQNGWRCYNFGELPDVVLLDIAL